MIETTVCARCGTSFTCVGARQKAYVRATISMEWGGKWRPVCSDKEDCVIRRKEKNPGSFKWNRSTRRSKNA